MTETQRELFQASVIAAHRLVAELEAQCLVAIGEMAQCEVRVRIEANKVGVEIGFTKMPIPEMEEAVKNSVTDAVLGALRPHVSLGDLREGVAFLFNPTTARD